jgi:hypothetical protein
VTPRARFRARAIRAVAFDGHMLLGGVAVAAALLTPL